MGSDFEVWCKLHAQINGDKVFFVPTMPGDASFAIFSPLTDEEQWDFDAIKKTFSEAYSSTQPRDAFCTELQVQIRKEGKTG